MIYMPLMACNGTKENAPGANQGDFPWEKGLESL